MELNIAICMSNPAELSKISQRIYESFKQNLCIAIISSYTNAFSLLQDHRWKPFNAFFLDTDLPDMNGITLAETLRAEETDSRLVFVYISSQDALVYQALRTEPLRFIRKAFFLQEIDEAVQAVVSFFGKIRPDVLNIQVNGWMYMLPISKIQYIETFNQKQAIHTDGNQYTVYSRLADFERKLKPMGFVRIHKSYLVNTAYIYSITPHNVVLYNQCQLPLSRYRAALVRQTCSELTSTFSAAVKLEWNSKLSIYNTSYTK